MADLEKLSMSSVVEISVVEYSLIDVDYASKKKNKLKKIFDDTYFSYAGEHRFAAQLGTS